MNKFQDSSAGVPSAAQLESARAAHWHQDGAAVVSLEAARAWLQSAGLVLYAPRPQVTCPAPTLVEATLGRAAAEPARADMDTAQSLLTRLVAEGAAVPLNLLGVQGAAGTDQPDHVVSAAVFSYIFTLRGNKAWKQAPSTSGAVKVSPLALAVYEELDKKVALSAAELATNLGKEVTEAAVLRALTELWGQLRVLPVPQTDGAATVWEPAQARLLKQIKNGANAGQPSALSALISLYLAQVLLASEDEIETFLSPLAARSRVRDVVHALMSARQLETVVIGGKTLLHVAGETPLAAAASAAPEEQEGAAEHPGEAVDAPRIEKFTPKKVGTGPRAKPFGGAKPSFGARQGGGGKPPFAKKPFGRPAAGEAAGGERERRPFARPDRPTGGSGERAGGGGFDRPWQERGARPARPGGGFQPSPRRSGDDRPAPPRDFAASAGDFAPRRTFSKPGTFGRKREGGATGGAGGFKPRSGPREGAAPRFERPAGDSFGGAGAADRGRAGFAGRSGSSGERPSFGARPAGADAGAQGGSGEAPRRTFRKFDAPRGKKPFAPRREAGAGAEAPRSFTPRPTSEGGFTPRPGGKPAFPKRPFAARGGDDAGRPPRPAFGGKPGGFSKPGGGFGKPGGGFSKPGGFVKRDAPAGGFSDRPRAPRPSGFAREGSSGASSTGRPGSFAGKPGGFARKPFSPGGGSPGGRPGGSFARPAGGARPSGGGFARPGGGARPFGGRPAGGARPPFRKPGGPRPGFAPAPGRRPEED